MFTLSNEHIEDELLNRGVAGGREAINFLRSLRDMLAGQSQSHVNVTTKWDAIKTNNSLSFETYVYEDGSDNANYVFTSNNSNVESISQINYGTGDNLVRNKDQSTYYSGVEPIFKNYGS